MFRRFCQASASKLKSLHFGNGKYKVDPLNDFTPATLKSKLDACADSLERVKFVGSHKEGAELLSTFAKYSYPRLVNLDADVVGIKEKLFPVLVEKSPNLKRLKWFISNAPEPVFPDCVRPNLESLELDECETDGLISMTGKLPNLKKLKISVVYAPDPIIDQFLATVPKLEVFYMRGPLHRELRYFWSLRNLVDATFIPPITNGLQLNDVDVARIASSFPRLRNLRIVDAFNFSTPGIAALGQLKELRKLDLSIIESSSSDHENGFQFLTGCKHLEIFRVDFDVHLSTMVGLIRNCPNLREISIQDVLGADHPGAIAADLLSLVEVGKRNVDVTFSLDALQNEIWKCDPVKAALEKVREAGVMLNVAYTDPVRPRYCNETLFSAGDGEDNVQLRLELHLARKQHRMYYF